VGGGGQARIYSPLGSTTTLGSNRPKHTLKITPQSRWREDRRGWLSLARSHWAAAPASLGIVDGP